MMSGSCLVIGILFLLVATCLSQYCSERSTECCPGRDDECSIEYRGTKCYCDTFCNHTAIDCCPDFWNLCLGVEPPSFDECYHNGVGYRAGAAIYINCNKCTCQRGVNGDSAFNCENKACTVRPSLIQAINHGGFGWRAANYTTFWGMKLTDAVKHKLGTLKVERDVHTMTEIDIKMKKKIPKSFDARDKWGSMITGILDQGNCASSWAFSTVGVASDRLAIQSSGETGMTLSPQHLLSCNTRGQRGCSGGHIDRAWWFMRKRGVVSNDCYPYTSGDQDKKGVCMMPGKLPSDCPTGRERNNELHHSTPPYRIAANEREIQVEIMENGPVQASFEVKEDFFMYGSGVYRHTPIASNDAEQYHASEWHSVKLLGWGVENGIKYWLGANSWGTKWGEDGYFKILRGENECNIESYVVAVWGKVDTSNKPNHRVTKRTANTRKRRSELNLFQWLFS
ncbi:tubulointerstitial nephritis antigen-like [Saccoglossus kowalevskii]|uniref:Tubulointerstitial nephritis antigen-like n=1 Tax=Saccoglossus kowalevskii TaxID=10224 RepID=A0ABM0GPE5_SACKO|nr:PREDICTED: tubulointerstitial nephritis antigen-like [Saccoglossus kowalevskii]